MSKAGSKPVRADGQVASPRIEEYARMKSADNPLVQQIEAEGKVLYEQQ